MNDPKFQRMVEFVLNEIGESTRLSPACKEWAANNPDHILRRFTTLIEVDHQAYERACARKV